MTTVADRVRETTSTTGTGTLSLIGAVTDFRAFSAAFSDGDKVYYCIELPGTGAWEVGIGTYNTGTLSRDTVLASSNAGALVNFAAGTKNVFCTLPARVPNNVDAMLQHLCDFRLTLTSGTPVTTADVTAAGTLYCTPYKGNSISLYDGDKWNVRSSAEFSLALSVTQDNAYDIFCYDNAGTLTLEALVWTNGTTRATALTLQDGVLVKSGATTRRYLGTIWGSGANTTEDSETNRYVWNYYNRVLRSLRFPFTTNTWTYTTATWREAGGTTSRIRYVCGVAEDMVKATVAVAARNDGAANSANMLAAIGVDSTTDPAGSIFPLSANFVTNTPQQIWATYQGFPGIGRHQLVALEFSTAAGTTTWIGDNGGTDNLSGIYGELLA